MVTHPSSPSKTLRAGSRQSLSPIIGPFIDSLEATVPR